MASKNIKLHPSGQEMPLIGFGLWKVNKDTCADTVYNAIKVGYRLFDGACDYGNEKEAGEGIRRAIKEGLVKREDLFITTKLWNTYHARQNVVPAFEKTLSDLGLEYVDLYLVHFPIALAFVPFDKRYPPGFFYDDAGKEVKLENSPMHETWAGMEEIHKSGRAKNIGISNFNGQLITDLLRYAKVHPSVLQIEHHPYYIQEELCKFAHDNKIAITAYSSFGPLSYIELEQKLAKSTPVLLEHPTISKIAQETKKSTAQVLLRWATQRGIAVIPKSNNHKRLEENLHCSDFDLSEEQIKAMNALDKNLKFNSPQNYGIPIWGTFA